MITALLSLPWKLWDRGGDAPGAIPESILEEPLYVPRLSPVRGNDADGVVRPSAGGRNPVSARRSTTFRASNAWKGL